MLVITAQTCCKPCTFCNYCNYIKLVLPVNISCETNWLMSRKHQLYRHQQMPTVKRWLRRILVNEGSSFQCLKEINDMRCECLIHIGPDLFIVWFFPFLFRKHWRKHLESGLRKQISTEAWWSIAIIEKFWSSVSQKSSSTICRPSSNCTWGPNITICQPSMFRKPLGFSPHMFDLTKLHHHTLSSSTYL